MLQGLDFVHRFIVVIVFRSYRVTLIFRRITEYIRGPWSVQIHFPFKCVAF